MALACSCSRSPRPCYRSGTLLSWPCTSHRDRPPGSAHAPPGRRTPVGLQASSHGVLRPFSAPSLVNRLPGTSSSDNTGGRCSPPSEPIARRRLARVGMRSGSRWPATAQQPTNRLPLYGGLQEAVVRPSAGERLLLGRARGGCGATPLMVRSHPSTSTRAFRSGPRFRPSRVFGPLTATSGTRGHRPTPGSIAAGGASAPCPMGLAPVRRRPSSRVPRGAFGRLASSGRPASVPVPHPEGCVPETSVDRRRGPPDLSDAPLATRWPRDLPEDRPKSLPCSASRPGSHRRDALRGERPRWLPGWT